MPSGGPGTNQYSAVNAEGGHPHIVEGVITPLYVIASIVLRRICSVCCIYVDLRSPIIMSGVFVGFRHT